MMTRCASLSITRLVGAALAVIGLFTLHFPACADIYSYAAQRRQIKAGILVSSASQNYLGANTGADNFVPHFFYVLEMRQDLKPAGWEFMNPIAPRSITADIYRRWQARAGAADPAFQAGTPESIAFQIGAPLTKNIGAYWEVNLDAVSMDDLKKFDVLLLASRNPNVSFSPEQRNKLRGFADGGGTLWLENIHGMNITGGQFLVDVVFTANADSAVNLADRRHPLVNGPYTISPTEVTALGSGGIPGRMFPRSLTAGYVAPGFMVPVIRFLNQYALGAGDYGAGHLIIGASGIPMGVNSYVGGPTFGGVGNSGAISGNQFANAFHLDLKVAYNAMAWASAVPTASVNVRRVGATNENIGYELGQKFSTVPPSPVTGIGSGAILYKGTIFWVDGNNVLHAYNATPGVSLDASRDYDNGIPDFSAGIPYDEIWQVNLGVAPGIRVSTPTILSYTDPNLNPALRDLVVVTTSTGTTIAYTAFPVDGNFRLRPTTFQRWRVNGNGTPLNLLVNYLPNPPDPNLATLPVPAPSPAFSEGVVFTLVYDNSFSPNAPWRIAALFPGTGTSVFGDGGVAPSVMNLVSGLPDVMGPLTVGYVQDEGSGALDKLITVATRSNAAPAPGQPAIPDRIVRLWFSTRNEPLQDAPNQAPNNRLAFRPTGSRSKIPWWAPSSLPGGADAALLPAVHIVRRDANLNVTGIQRLLFANNEFTVTYEGTAGNRDVQVNLSGNALTANDLIYADYTVDWPAVAVGSSNPAPTAVEMQRVFESRRFTTVNPRVAAAMPVRDSFVIGSAALSAEDSLLFNVNDTRIPVGSPVPDRTYNLRDQFPIDGGTLAQEGQIGGRLKWMFAPINGGTYGNDTYASRLGVTTRDFKAIGSPVSSNGIVYVLGTVNNGSATVIMALRENPNMTFNVQTTLLGAGGVTLQQIDPVRSAGGAPQYITLREGVNFTKNIETGAITIRDCYDRDSREAFNLGMPFYLNIGNNNQLELIRDSRGLSPLDNLQWYTILPGILAASSPSVVGDTIYFGTRNGMVVSVETPKGTVSGSVTPKFTIRPVLYTGNPTDFPVIHPPVASTGMMIVGLNVPGTNLSSLSAFDNQLTIIADRERILEVNFEGNAVWSMDATRALSVVGGALNNSGRTAATKIALSFPNVARRATLNQFLIADTGNHRLCQVDRGGLVYWELRSARNDMGFLRPGEPVTLNSPTDVQSIVEEGVQISLPNRDRRDAMGNPVVYTYDGSAGPYYGLRYLIADSGNNRIIEVLSAWTRRGAPIILTGSDGSQITLLNQAVFSSRTLTEQNANLRYRTIQQFVDNTGAPYLIAAVDNQRQAALDPGSIGRGLNGSNAVGPGGSLVVMQRDYTLGPNNKDGQIIAVVNSILIPDSAAPGGFRRQDISNPTWFKQINVAGQIRYLLADENGCYELLPQPVNGSPEVVVQWMLSSRDYERLAGRPLRAASIQRLNQSDFYNGVFYPHYLITNRYTGAINFAGITAADELRGEVLQIRSIAYARRLVNGDYLPTDRRYLFINGLWQVNDTGLVAWAAPREYFAIVQGGQRLKRRIGAVDGGASTYLLEQPTFSDRPF